MINIPVKIYSMTVRFFDCARDDGVKFATMEMTNQTIDVYCALDEGESIYSHWFIQCLCHEMNHAAMCILGSSGVKYNYKNQEALCYLQDFLIKEVLDKLSTKAKRQQAERG